MKAPEHKPRHEQDPGPVLEILDDCLPASLHTAASGVCAGKGWYFGHGSRDGDWSRFWKMDLDGDPTFDAVWEYLRPRCEDLAGVPLRVNRQYANGHTYGLGGQPHVDDDRPGSFTLLYYPMTEWKDGWDGETVFYDKSGEIALSLLPRPNRAVLFDSRIPHAGRAPSRQCPALRVTVAFKLQAAPSAPPAAHSADHHDGPNDGPNDGPTRILAVRVPATEVERAVREHLDQLAVTLRLPGFRPGKIPLAVIEQRYGVQARQDVVNRLGIEAASRAVPEGAVASSVDLVSGSESGDLELRLTATYLPALPDCDFSGQTLERLTAAKADLDACGLDADQAAGLFNSHLRQQALERLNEAYSFPIAPAIVDREFTALWREAESRLGAQPLNAEESATLAAEFKAIAERRVRLGLVVAEMARRHGIRCAQGAALEAAVIDYFVSRARVSERLATPAELRELMD